MTSSQNVLQLEIPLQERLLPIGPQRDSSYVPDESSSTTNFIGNIFKH